MEFLTSFYNGVSGINAMSQQLNVTANNVANANSTAFKASQANFVDVLETVMSPMVSVGHGVQLGSLSTSFTSGTLESTTRAEDMAITGSGFFQLRDSERTAADSYTRNGAFNLVQHFGTETNAYNLVSGNGQFVQGYNLAATTVPADVVDDILIKNIAPQSATTEVSVMANLEYRPALVEGVDTPLFSSWNGSSTTPLAVGTYEYTAELKIYGTDQGEATTADSSYDYLTIYFDSTANQNEKEFLVTCHPTMDHRLIAGSDTRYDSTTDRGAGALLYGILHFNINGALNDIECWQVPPNGDVAPGQRQQNRPHPREAFYSFDYNLTGDAANTTATLNFGTVAKPQVVISPATAFSSASNASPATAFSSWNSMYDSLGNQVKEGDTINFLGTTGDGTPLDYTYTVTTSQSTQDLLIALENQFACTAEIIEGKLTITDTVVGDSQLSIDAISYASASGATPLTDPTVAQIFGSQGESFTVDSENRYIGGPLTTTSYASPSAILFQSQNGFGRGKLQDIQVDRLGNIIGRYSNGQDIKQAQLVLANFANTQGLMNKGDTIFFATTKSGESILGTAGQGSFGTVTNRALEMSNVDVGMEMATLIATQRAYQANAKSISTLDEIYDKVLQMVRA